MVTVLLLRTTRAVRRGLNAILGNEIVFLAVIQVVCVLSEHVAIETFQTECMIGDHDIVLWSKGYSGCIDECRARADCEAINVHVRLRMCRMHMQDTDTLRPCENNDAGFLFLEKKNWNQKILPGCEDASCVPGHTCEADHNTQGAATCVPTECPTPTVPSNGSYLGNERSVGARVCYNCLAPFVMNGQRCLQCDTTGTWNDAPPACVHCAESRYLITGPYGLPDEALTASSSYSPKHVPNRSRLNTTHTAAMMGAWSAQKSTEYEWIQARFSDRKVVKDIAIQGREGPHRQYVTEFRFSYSTDCMQFQNVFNSDGVAMLFAGNTDQSTIVILTLPEPVIALCVRINPTRWFGHISLRWDIIGC